MTTSVVSEPVPRENANGEVGETVYFDGRFIAKAEVRISPDDRGFLLGDGIYEVVAAYDGRFVALDRHMQRLRRSLVQAHIDSDVADPMETVFQELLERNELSGCDKAMVYLQITRGVAARTHAFPKTRVRPTVYAYATPIAPMGDLSAGVAAITSEDLRWSRCDIKSISLIANCMANQSAKERDAFEAILVRDNFALEGTHTSFFGILDGVVYTAPLSNLILPGITREIVIEECIRNGIVVVEEALSVDALPAADELFITGTTTEVVPLTKLDGRHVGDGSPGLLTRRIAELYRSAAGLGT